MGLRHPKSITTIGVLYSEDAEDGNELTACIDADYAGDMGTRYSTTGSVIVLGRSSGRLDSGKGWVYSAIGVCSSFESVADDTPPQALTRNDTR